LSSAIDDSAATSALRTNPDRDGTSQINQRDSKIAKDTLPPVGSFGLIKDLVRDYTELTVVQEKERKKHEIDSLRAYPGTNIAKTMAMTVRHDSSRNGEYHELA
jgi:hypothetical protein